MVAEMVASLPSVLALGRERSSRTPAFLAPVLRNVIVSLARLPLVNSYTRVPPLVSQARALRGPRRETHRQAPGSGPGVEPGLGCSEARCGQGAACVQTPRLASAGGRLPDPSWAWRWSRADRGERVHQGGGGPLPRGLAVGGKVARSGLLLRKSPAA